MKNGNLKMVCIMLIAVLMISIIPSFVRADEEKNAVVLEKSNGDKIIYIEGLETTDFKFAFSDDKNDANPSYQSSMTDSDGKNVAFLSNSQTYKYMFIAEQNKTSVIEFNTLKSITEDEIEEINTLTERIKVETGSSTSNSSKKEDGTVVTTTQGKIKIVNEENYDYNYSLIEIVDKNGTVTTPNQTAVELCEQLTTIKNSKTTYEKLISAMKIRDDFNLLIQNAKWNKVENGEIMQPEDSQQAEKFVVLIEKTVGREKIYDVQFMTCGRQDAEGVENTNTVQTKTVEKKTMLPITGENVILYIALGLILIAIIAVLVRMKQLKGKNNEKH